MGRTDTHTPHMSCPYPSPAGALAGTWGQLWRDKSIFGILLCNVEVPVFNRGVSLKH